MSDTDDEIQKLEQCALEIKKIKSERDWNKWSEFIGSQIKLPYMQKLQERLKEARTKTKVYPDSNLIMNAFKLAPYFDLKVVLIGDEPLCDGNDMGLSFSSIGGEVPPAQQQLRNEIVADVYPEFLRVKKEFNGWKTCNLKQWSTQGVLLLNSILTVEADKPGSHRNWGWETFTIETVRWLSETHPKKLVFILTGKHLHNYRDQIDEKRHLILGGPNITGTKAFTKANKFIYATSQREPIGWHLLN